MMKDWNATVQVLQEKDKFAARCGTTLPNLSFPCQIYKINTMGGFHESIARKLKMAGSAISGNLSELQSQIQNMQRDMDRGFHQMDKCIDGQQKDYALLAMQNSSVLQERKSIIDINIMHKSLMFNMMTEEKQRQTRIEVEELQKQRKEVEKELEDLRAAARGFTTPYLPPPPAHDATPASTALIQPQVAPLIQTQADSEPVPEPQTKRQVTRSSVRAIQNTSHAVNPKKGKTEVLAASLQDVTAAADRTDDDFEMVPSGQGQVCYSHPTENVLNTENTLQQVTTIPKTARDFSQVDSLPCIDVVTCWRDSSCTISFTRQLYL
jgi:hypothetical protein